MKSHVVGGWALLRMWEDMRLERCMETASQGGWLEPGLTLGIISGGGSY